MAPFGNIEDFGSHDFSFEIKRKPVNVEEDVKDVVVARPDDDLVVDSVEFGVGVDKKRSDMNVRFDFMPRKQLIVVTPTYDRALQAFYLNRLGQLLRLVPPPLIWIVVEMDTASMETAEILRKTGAMYRHLVCTKNSTNIKDRGVHQRNTALEHIEHHKLDGIVYFADDDNIYSLELFERIREIRYIHFICLHFLFHYYNVMLEFHVSFLVFMYLYYMYFGFICILGVTIDK